METADIQGQVKTDENGKKTVDSKEEAEKRIANGVFTGKTLTH